jgi:5'-nucleotidase
VILSEGGSPSNPTYRLQPLQPVIGPANAETPIVFPNTRASGPDASHIAAEGTPAVKIASFNVLNYFTTLGDPDDDNVGDGGCTAFTDRDGDGNNVRGGCDQRGAWDPEDLDRQQTKIVRAINALDADVVGLMEIENSLALGEEPDEAVRSLVAALNAARPGTWAANPSSAELPPVEQMDVISNAIIYKRSAVARLGEARALGDQSEGDDTSADEPFANAREPIAQAFTPRDGGEPFLVVVNHFKSKGSPGPFPGDDDSGDGQGNSNESRTRQAEALVEWVPTIQGNVDDVLLLGDFNSYTQEDPIRILYGADYTDLAEEGDYSYSFGGQSGSLDHVVANEGALERFTGSDVWNINAVEPLILEYSRWNSYGTDFHADNPFRSSDHDPVVVGLTEGATPRVTPEMRVQVKPRKVVARETRPRVIVRMDGSEGPVTGEVRVRSRGKVREAELVGERARITMPTYQAPGRARLRIVYLGDDQYERVGKTRVVKVRPRR